MLDGIPGTVFTTGDNAYSDGSAANFADCYEPTWGRHKSRTRPTPGNHDYGTSGAAGYFAYFGSRAGTAGAGYYSYDLGDWHIIALNSELSMDAGSAQEQWLRADLAANTRDCILAYWHHPVFSSGPHGGSSEGRTAFQLLYEAGAEVVLVGHDHNYQRSAPLAPNGQPDPQRGIRQFVVGTGGAGTEGFGSPDAHVEAWDVRTHGVLKLTLGRGTYAWEFVPVAGATFRDSGTGSCHR